jgi:Tol biopolymer transport system component
MSYALDRLTAALADRYRIERELGRGGMATVYLAQDLKHDRKVALKVLKPELAAVLGAERFVVEIKTTAALQHPHILPLFDSGTADGFLYYVMPYIQGETLRAKLDRETQLGIEEAVRITTDVADALDYAHRHGVIHRDIKPENILLHDGRPMVTDFGIALAVSAAAGGRMTETGLSLGTPHYMSPEQATAEKELTARSDIYSLGSVLYEMLTGNPPHTGASVQQIIMKIVTEDVAPVTKLRRAVPPNVAAAVGKAVERLPADRFDSAARFAEALTNPAFTTASVAGLHAESGMDARRVGAWIRSPWSWGALTTAAAAIIAAAIALRGAGGRNPEVRFTQKTFRSEAIYTARLAPDGQTIVYSSTGKEGTVPHLYVIRPDNPEPVPLGPDSTHLLAISSTGQMAVLTGARYIAQRLFLGTLSTLPLGGGAPREVLAGVREADWSPDGTAMAVTRNVDGADRLEYPVGKVLYQSPGYVSDVRISPSGDEVAFLEHPVPWDDRGEAVIIDRTGKLIAKSATYWAIEGLGWSHDGQQIFYSGAASVGSYMEMTVYAMDRRNKVHRALSSAGGITLQDAHRGGRWLVTHDEQRFQVRLKDPASAEERDMGWMDASSNPVLSADGKLLSLSDQSATGGLHYTVLLRKTDGSPAARLGDGGPVAFSRDGRSLLVSVLSTPPQLMLYPTGPGEPRRLDQGQFESLTFSYGALFADGERFFTCGSLPKQGTRCFVGAMAGGPLTPVTPEGTVQAVLSPDDKTIAAQVGDSINLYSLTGGSPRRALGLSADDYLSRWSPDGRELWVYGELSSVMRVDRVDPQTGKRSLLTQITPSDPAGLREAVGLRFADDPRVYAYRQTRYTSSLFVVEGAR